MVELNHNVANVNADSTIKGGHGVVVAVKVTKKGSSGSKIQLRNGTSNSDPIEFTVFGKIYKIMEESIEDLRMVLDVI